MNELLTNIIATVTGGVLLTFILFLLNEYAFPKANLTGEWIASVKITKSTYGSYNNLFVVYKIHLLQKGYDLTGSGEKIKDILPDGTETIFELNKRVSISIEGYYERKYFSKSKVFLNITEEGRLRESRTTYFLILENKSKLKGSFIATVATSSGNVDLEKSF